MKIPKELLGEKSIKSIEILEIKKRNWFIRIFTINYWKVTNKINGKIKKYNCWAGVLNPHLTDVFYSLLDKHLNLNSQDYRYWMEKLTKELM